MSIQSLALLINFSLLQMATLNNKRKLVAINHEGLSRENKARYTIVPRNQEDYLNQVTEDIGSRATKKLSQELSCPDNQSFSPFSGK